MNPHIHSRPDEARSRQRAAYAWLMLIAEAAALYLVLLFKKWGTRGKNATSWEGIAALILYPYVLAHYWVATGHNLLTFPESFFLIYGSFLLLLAGHRLASLFQRYVRRNYEHTHFMGISIFESRGRDRNLALLYEIVGGFALTGVGFCLSTSIGSFLVASAIGLTIKNVVALVEIQTLRDAISNAEIESEWADSLRRR